MKVKLVAESLDEAITRSFDTPMTREEVIRIIEKILKKFKSEARPITSMTHWLDLNNIGSYQHNKWIRAIVDTLFLNSGGTWTLKNRQLSIEQLADLVMGFWQKKMTA